jgi:hypothetical protein
MTQLFALLLTLAVIDAAPPIAQPGSGTVRITVPGVVLIPVDDVSAATASSGPARISFNQAFLSAGQALRISVKADTSLTLPGGVSVPASSITWTTSGANNGVGINGALSTGAYTPVFESGVDARSGRVDLTWQLALPPGLARAGTAQIVLRWKLEAFVP